MSDTEHDAPPATPRRAFVDDATGELRRVSLDDETQEIPLLSRLNDRGFRLVMVLDVLALVAILFGTMFVRFTRVGQAWPRGPAPDFPYTTNAYLMSFAVLVVLHFLMFYFGGLYERDPRLGYPPILPRAASLSVVAILVFMGIAFVLGAPGIRPLPAPTVNLVVLALVGPVAVTANRWLARWDVHRRHGPPRVLLIGAPDQVATAQAHLLADRERVVVAGEASSPERLVRRVTELDATDVILLSGEWLDHLYPDVLREFEARDVGILQRVTAKETLYGLKRVREVGGMPFVALREHAMPISRVRFKRALEIGYLVVGAPLWLPLLGVLGLYSLVVVGRPVFYWQLRVGRDGVPYRMVKFRTMELEAERETGPTLAEQRDPRVVRGCGWLRSTRLDELPQVWNVIRGEMSLVGPRPERPELTAEYEQLIPGYATRYEIPPGITGLAQVQGRYRTDPEYKLGYDIQYLVNWSPLLDLQILLRTVWVVLARRE